MSPPIGTVAPAGVNIAYRRFEPDESRRQEQRCAASAPAPVLLIHGMGGDGRTWDAFVRTLVSRGRTAITVDLRGHGRSGRAPSYRFEEFAQDVLGLCEHMGLRRVDVVGHSLGGYAASRIAQQRPGLIERLVLEEMPMPLGAGDPIPDVPSHRPTPREMWNAAASFMRNPRGLLGYDRSLTDPAMTQFRTPNPGWWDSLGDIIAPVLFLRGTRPGSMVDPALLARMSQRMPGLAVREVSCGHSIHRDRRDRFAEIVAPFLDGY